MIGEDIHTCDMAMIKSKHFSTKLPLMSRDGNGAIPGGDYRNVLLPE
jgi:hypothetical protein